ncbi:MAG: ComF family protein [Acidobacteria bacterium]|nr:ComF family protein [Acidobacteriota bacterium]
MPLTWLDRAGSPLLALLFPDDCRLCAGPLKGFPRIPVCASCLDAPAVNAEQHYCAACRTPFLNARPLNEQGLCRLCAAGFTRFDAAYSYGNYHGGLHGLIHLFKYGRMRPLAAPLGRMLSSALPRDQVFDAIVPMPLHWRKLLVRGFNQSHLLAKELTRRTGIPTEPLLRRRRHTAAQAGLSSAQRRANVAGAFTAGSDAQGRRLLLVDDVFTTGATVNAAATALKRAGAARVAILTLARTDRLQNVRSLQSDSPSERGATE